MGENQNEENKIPSRNLSEDEMKDMVQDSQLYVSEITSIVEKEGLGSVDRVHGTRQPSGKTADMYLGWHTLDISSLPSMGRFYPIDTKITIRAAKAAEIRQWSTLNENDMFDIDSKLNFIVQSCTRVYSGNRLISWKDILEEDRFHVLLEIRELTFKEGEQKLQISKQCQHCGTKNTVDINTASLDRMPINETIEKYYDENSRSYKVQTKSYGVITLSPPTIGVMSEVSEYIRSKQREGVYWDESFIQLFPYLYPDWRGVNSKYIFDKEVEFHGWDSEGKKYSLIYRLAEMIKVGSKPEINTNCTGCHEEMAIPINFRDGIKAIFIPVVSDEFDELL